MDTNELLIHLTAYHRAIDEIATIMGYKTGDTIDLDTLVQKIKTLKSK